MVLRLVWGSLYPAQWLAVGLPLQLPSLLSVYQTQLGSRLGSIFTKDLTLGELCFISLAFSNAKKAIISPFLTELLSRLKEMTVIKHKDQSLVHMEHHGC